MRRAAPRRLGTPGRRRLHVTVRVTVPFQDADPTGDVWHGNYFRYFDSARVALLDRLSYGYRAMAESGYSWPIVDTRVRYVRGVTYGEAVDVTATLEEWEYRLRIAYEIRDVGGRRVTEAYTVQVPVDLTTGEMCFGLPERMRRRIDERVQAALDD